jgi:hypothetical protein
MGGELRRKCPMGRIRFGDDENSTRILVKTVNDSGPLHATDSGEAFATMRDERINERASFVTGPRMNNETCRLVDDDDFTIFVKIIEAHGLGHRLGRKRRWYVQNIGGAGFDLAPRVSYRFTILGELAFTYQPLQACPAELGRVRVQPSVQPRTTVTAGRLSGELNIANRRTCGLQRGGKSFWRFVCMSNARQSADPFTPGQMWALKIAVIVMTLILIVGFPALLISIAYQSANGKDAQLKGPSLSAAELRALYPGSSAVAELPLPRGARVASLSQAGDKLLLAIEDSGGTSILSLDLKSQKVEALARLRPRDGTDP